MKSFIQFKETLNEGGNAVGGVVRINQENTQATVDNIFSELLPKLKLKNTDAALLGSTGKKAPKSSSGDIDMALSATQLLKMNGIDTYVHALTGLAEAHGERFRPTVGLKNMVAAGRLGRKSGRGFYGYDREGRRESNSES